MNKKQEKRDCSNCGSLVHCSADRMVSQEKFVEIMEGFSCPCWIDMVGTESDWKKYGPKIKVDDL